MNNPHLKLGDTHKAVKHLIRALRKSKLGYYPNRPSGWVWWDKLTLRKAKYKHYTQSISSVVWGFQIREGLPRTGECDAATWAKLKRFL